jgi:DNA-binding NarL/FixJ family response regulator
MVMDVMKEDAQVMQLSFDEFRANRYKILGETRFDVMLLGCSRLDNMYDVQTDVYPSFQLIRLHYPSARMIAHSIYSDPENVSRILGSGIQGFVSKLGPEGEIVKAVVEVWKGNRYVCSQTSLALKNAVAFLNGTTDHLLKNERIFSYRELNVLQLMGIGLNSREIAESLDISPKTVETHRKSLISKSQVKNTTQLIAFCSLHGYL